MLSFFQTDMKYERVKNGKNEQCQNSWNKKSENDCCGHSSEQRVENERKHTENRRKGSQWDGTDTADSRIDERYERIFPQFLYFKIDFINKHNDIFYHHSGKRNGSDNGHETERHAKKQ